MENLDKWKAFSLKPLALVWQGLSHLRRACYQRGVFLPETFGVPIISIGNLTFGGTGKTPLTLWMADFLQGHNLRPLVLMRGYRGEFEKSASFLPGGKEFLSTSRYYGDEPMLIARRLKEGGVVVGRNRAANLKFYFDKVRPQVVLLDDGYQHLEIRRNLNIVLFDALCPLDHYQVAPSGRMREGMGSLKDADVLVLSRADQATPGQMEALRSLLEPFLPPQILKVAVRYRPTGVFKGNHEWYASPEELSGKRIIALAALASPRSFFKGLETLGATLVDTIVFPDHYYFQEADLKEILRKARKLKAKIITTEKDMIKIRRITLSERVLYLRVEIDFIEGEELLKTKILETIHNVPGHS